MASEVGSSRTTLQNSHRSSCQNPTKISDPSLLMQGRARQGRLLHHCFRTAKESSPIHSISALPPGTPQPEPTRPAGPRINNFQFLRNRCLGLAAAAAISTPAHQDKAALHTTFSILRNVTMRVPTGHHRAMCLAEPRSACLVQAPAPVWVLEQSMRRERPGPTYQYALQDLLVGPRMAMATILGIYLSIHT